MVSVHYGLWRSPLRYVNVFTIRLHMGNMNWHCYVSICQNVEGPCQLMCQCLTASRSESHLRKLREMFIQMNQRNCLGGSNGRIIDGGRHKGGP